MYNSPDSFQDVLRELEANMHRAKETDDPFAPAPKPGSGAQPKCEEAQAFDSVAAGAAELLKTQKAMQAYPYIDEGTRVVRPIYMNPRMTAAEGPNFGKIPELKTPQFVIDALEKAGIKETERYVPNDARQKIAKLKATIKNWEWAVDVFHRAHLAGSITVSGGARNRLFDMLPPAEKQQPTPQQVPDSDLAAGEYTSVAEVKQQIPYPLVRIEWLDSRQPSSSWEFAKDLSGTACKCTSIGWLIHETKNSITIAPNAADVGNNMQISGHIVIPVKAITNKSMFTSEHGQLTTK